MSEAIRVDLYSDTLTQPSAAMRRFMCEAPVGDEQRGEDPTVNRLQEMVAELLGKEAALFLPSGTMCNEIAFAVHCRPGDEILMDRTAHPLNFEAGAPAVICGALIHPLDGRRGIFSAAQVEAAIRPRSRYAPRSRLLAVEQITNLGGGAVWPLAELRAVAEVARRHGLASHLDGARLLNAVAASGVSARDYAAPFDSAWLDFSKGLGAPMGAVLAGSAAFIEEAWYWKQRLGGALRQAGIVAAAGIYALEHNIERLSKDHANAQLLARGLAALPGITLDPAEVEANIILFDVAGTGLSAAEFVRRLRAEHGVRMGAFGPSTVRAITHLDVSRAGVNEALEAVTRLLG